MVNYVSFFVEFESGPCQIRDCSILSRVFMVVHIYRDKWILWQQNSPAFRVGKGSTSRHTNSHMTRYNVMHPRPPRVKLCHGNPFRIFMSTLGYRHLDSGLPVHHFIWNINVLFELNNKIWITYPPA